MAGCIVAIANLTEMKWSELGGQVEYVYARGTSSNAYDGSGKVRREKKRYEIAVFKTGYTKKTERGFLCISMLTATKLWRRHYST